MDNLGRDIDKKTLDAFQSAVQQVSEKPPSNYMTTRELAQLWGVARRTAFDRIKKLIDEGQVETVIVRIRGRVDGRAYPVPHYRIKK
jgi:DNA-binding Lrp family transcriptional regulator